METKLIISHKVLWNCIELVNHVKKSIIYIDEDRNRRKLLNYLIRFFKVFEKFVHVYLDYKYPHDLNRFAPDSVAEINKACNCVKDILHIVKAHVSVFFRSNARANNIIKSICFKAIARFQSYLVDINFFNKEMFHISALNLA